MTPADHPTFLIRHGEVHNPEGVVYADLEGFGLSELGRAQAAATATRLPAGSTIIASPLQRAVETANIIAGDIAGDIAASVTVDEDLTEWRLGQRWAGEIWESIDERFPGELTAYLEHPNDLDFAGETLAILAARVAGAVRRHRLASQGPLVIVSHQDPIQAARLTLTGRTLTNLHQDKPAHAAVVTLEGSGDGPWDEIAMWAPAQGEVFPPI
jgi:probable phosphoglycerate mutase